MNTKTKPTPMLRVLRILAIPLLLLGAYAVWEPGADVRDGSHDRGHNGLWLAHGWLGGDEWFQNKRGEIPKYRSSEALAALAERCRKNHLTDLFPHLCPCTHEGALPPVNGEQVERFLSALPPETRVLPWIGGPAPEPARYADAAWRATFCRQAGDLLRAHPRLAGVQLNIEPMRSGDAAYLTLLEELRAALPEGKILSVAAYPPPTRWQPTEDVHWEEAYFRAVAQRADQLAVMLYDTGLTREKLYRKLMSDWTVEVLAWSGGKPVLLGLPAYEDAGVGYHDPAVENLENGLAGLHAGLIRAGMPANYRGAAIYCHWEMDAKKWADWRERFLRRE